MKNGENVWKIIYSSEKSENFDPDELHSMLDSFRIRNEKRNITGELLYSQGLFFQVLEGDREQLEDLYLKCRILESLLYGINR